MTSTRVEIRRGAYYDSVVLMRLQRALADQPGVLDAGVVMATPANKELLAQGDLLPDESAGAGANDLLIVIRGKDDAAAQNALDSVDRLLQQRSTADTGSYRPKSLATAVSMLGGAHWVLISTPGRYAAGVAREALQLGKHVFLYSDNVSPQEELELKERATRQGLLVMGPDCGTAIINGVGFGFANRVRRGRIGLVAASGTGLQAVSVAIHRGGGGISHAIGTGGRDLSGEIGGRTARQAIALLDRDEGTDVIVLVSKPPSPVVARQVLDVVASSSKPVIVNFVGYHSPLSRERNLHFASTFEGAATLALSLLDGDARSLADPAEEAPRFEPPRRYLRGLFSGGTLAYEAQLLLAPFLGRIYSNVPLEKEDRLADPLKSQEHTIMDLGEDVFTVGRLHPMMDNDLRLRRLREEASDPEVAIILLDLVLGDGAHPDPASEIAPSIREARQSASGAGGDLEVVVLVIGTEEDPQGLDGQVEQLRESGAKIFFSGEEAARYIGSALRATEPPAGTTSFVAPDIALLREPVRAINVGVEWFAASLSAQGADVVQVDWRPPAGGDSRLASLLERMR